jgi:RNA polymerase sigma-70 factor, ECF subfamily
MQPDQGLHPVPEPADAVTRLLSQVGRGDEQAFRDLYDHIAGWVYGIILRVVRDPSQSEEVAQEVMVEIWRQATRFDAARGSGKAWVLTMAHRRAVDRVRSAQASVERDRRVAARSYERPRDVVSEQVELRLDRQRVRHLLSELTDRQRQTIELAYYKGFSQQEIADVLDLPLGTVKTRMRDGLIRLRDAMEVGS